jgi:hypothetical protein
MTPARFFNAEEGRTATAARPTTPEGAMPGTISADLFAAGGDLNGPQARASLAPLAPAGVNEVVLNPGASKPSGPGFSLVGRFGDRAVYRVGRPPGEVAVAALPGAYPPEPRPDGSNFNWLGPRARLALVARPGGLVEVTFDAVRYGEPRHVRSGAARVFSGDCAHESPILHCCKCRRHDDCGTQR